MELVLKLLAFSVFLTLLIQLLTFLVAYIGIFAENKKREKCCKRRKKKNELYSESELEPLSGIKSPSHNEYERCKSEFDDLLAAVIIDKEEFDERILQVRL